MSKLKLSAETKGRSQIPIGLTEGQHDASFEGNSIQSQRTEGFTLIRRARKERDADC